MSDLVNRLENLKKEIDSVKSLSIELRTNEKREREECQIILDKMRAMGLNPKTLKDDILNMERDIEIKVSEKEKEVKEVKATLENIEFQARSVV